MAGMAPSRGYNLASGTLFRMKLTEEIEQKLKRTMLALFGEVTRIKRLFWAQLKKTRGRENDCH